MNKQLDYSSYSRAEAVQAGFGPGILSRLPGHHALRPNASLATDRLLQCLEDGSGVLDRANDPKLFTPEEVLLMAEVGAGVAQTAHKLGLAYRPSHGFGSSLSLMRLLTNIENCVGSSRYRIFEINPGGTWFGMLALNLGHSYAATEPRPDYYLTRAFLLRYFAGENFADWSQIEPQPGVLASEATLLPWWNYIALLESLSFGVDIVIWREPTAIDARYDIDFVLRLSRLMLKTSELGLFICSYPTTESRSLPIISHYERFGFKKAFAGEWCGYVPEELPSDPRLAVLGGEPTPYTPSAAPNRFTTEQVLDEALANAIGAARRQV